MTDQPAQRATQLAERFWNGLLELEPLTGTYVGDERFDDRLSERHTLHRCERCERFRDRRV